MMKKWLYLVTALVIVGGVLFVYVSFNGNFISKMLAKNVAHNYLETNYPEGNYTLGGGSYNFKDSTYVFDFSYYSKAHEQTWNYTLEVGDGLYPTTVRYVYMDQASLDVEATDQWNETGSDYVNKLLQGLPIAVSARYDVRVPVGFAKDITEWMPNVEAPIATSIYINTNYYNGETKEQFLQLAKEIQQRLNESPLNYHGVQIMMDEKIDNRDGVKEGYAPIYYETKYRISFEHDDQLNEQFLQ